MAIVQTILAALARQTGKLLNTVFGWATTTLFGKVPQARQTWLSVLSLASVAWMIVVVGVIFPKAAVFLLSFVTLPPWVDDRMIRLAMLAAALVLPLVVGFVSLKLLDPADRPKGAGATLKAILRGYPSTVAIAVALIMMIVFVPVMKARTMLKRWTSEHLPMVVEEQDYLRTVADIEAALDQAGFEVDRKRAGFMLRLPLKVITALGRGGARNLISDNLTTLVSPRLELILHPSDLVINGSKYDAARVRAIVAEQLSFSEAYLTWTKEGNEMEDRLREAWHEVRGQFRARRRPRRRGAAGHRGRPPRGEDRTRRVGDPLPQQAAGRARPAAGGRRADGPAEGAQRGRRGHPGCRPDRGRPAGGREGRAGAVAAVRRGACLGPHPPPLSAAWARQRQVWLLLSRRDRRAHRERVEWNLRCWRCVSDVETAVSYSKGGRYEPPPVSHPRTDRLAYGELRSAARTDPCSRHSHIFRRAS